MNNIKTIHCTKLSSERKNELVEQTKVKFAFTSQYRSINNICGYNYHHATCKSKFTVINFDYTFMPNTVTQITKRYFIDGLEVGQDIFNEVYNTIYDILNNVIDIKVFPQSSSFYETTTITFDIYEIVTQNDEGYIRGKRANSVYYDESFIGCTKEYKDFMTLLEENYLKKENEDMPKIVDYTYIEHDKVTKIKWSDGSETVVCGSGDDATQFCGYVCAIAKKAMGNNGKMLAEWDRLVVKPVERAKKAEEKKRLAAEKKAEEERIREEARAKRMAKNAKYYEEREKRRKQREVEALAEQIAKEYEQDKLYAEAMKLAIEKYKVPCNYFADDCDCHCGCKEFDVMDEDENNISD